MFMILLGYRSIILGAIICMYRARTIKSTWYSSNNANCRLSAVSLFSWVMGIWKKGISNCLAIYSRSTWLLRIKGISIASSPELNLLNKSYRQCLYLETMRAIFGFLDPKYKLHSI